MTVSPTIGGLLEKAGAQYRVFDLGRRVTKVPRTLFAQVEEGARPYPYPLQQQVWLGILFWSPDRCGQHFVWFLRFPLDEVGQLQFAARDEFLSSVLQSLGDQQKPQAERIEQAHHESPFAFKPAEERLAAFHAQALAALKLPPSQFYAHAREYLSGKNGYEQWAFVGLQGLADLVARLDTGDNAALLERALPQLPPEPLTALCRLLENVALDGDTAAALEKRLLEGLSDEQSRTPLIAALLRGLGATDRGGFRQRAVEAALGSALAHELEILVAISGRGWEVLWEPGVRLRFLECLARCEAGGNVFAQVVGDLLFIPGMRPHMLESFRSSERSDRLATAIGELMRGVS